MDEFLAELAGEIEDADPLADRLEAAGLPPVTLDHADLFSPPWCTWIYRYHDHTGRLLYVGTTIDLCRRLVEHRRTAPWFAEVARIHAEGWYPGRAARQEEARQIREDRPLRNHTHNRGPP